jgi:ATP phosphoribosyltransferase regulatory subunit
MEMKAANALLPAGLSDELPPRAGFEADVIERLMAVFAGYGYERVKPPLVEFEDSLLSGPGEVLTAQTFRLMDPQSHRMMGVRPDMTVQVARVAATRLAGAPRPLRLSYAGEVLHVHGTQLRPERQFVQAGFELICGYSLEGDAEVITVAAEALQVVGVKNLSLDLALPTFVPAVCRGLELGAEDTEIARDLLDRKDVSALLRFGEPAGSVLKKILRASGPADTAQARLRELDLEGEAAQMRDDLGDLLAHLESRASHLTLTVDPGEFRGFEYHTGTSFTIFSRGVRGELGRGGRYRLDNGEPAVGVTIYLDTLLRAVPEATPGESVFLPFGTPPEAGHELRAGGWRTVAGLTATDDDGAEAERLNCTHLLRDGKPQELS